MIDPTNPAPKRFTAPEIRMWRERLIRECYYCTHGERCGLHDLMTQAADDAAFREQHEGEEAARQKFIEAVEGFGPDGGEDDLLKFNRAVCVRLCQIGALSPESQAILSLGVQAEKLGKKLRADLSRAKEELAEAQEDAALIRTAKFSAEPALRTLGCKPSEDGKTWLKAEPHSGWCMGRIDCIDIDGEHYHPITIPPESAPAPDAKEEGK